MRRYDRHTGVDLYAPEGSQVLACEDGIVVGSGQFTGPEVGSPWWNPTSYVAVKGATGIILYGELDQERWVGASLLRGDLVGRVKRVLRHDKGRPMSMLHLELYSSFLVPVDWKRNENQPVNLLDPTPYLKGAHNEDV